MKAVLFIISLGLYSSIQAQHTNDSVPSSAIKIKPIISTGPAADAAKYDFKPIYNPLKTYKNNKTIESTSSFQTSGNLTNLNYALNDEAQKYIAWFKPKNEAELRSMKSWGAYYLSTMEGILQSQGIPKQLVYLSVIETHLNPNLVSWAGAAGIWQFIPETGRMYGLQIGNGVDERFNWIKSTYAAAGYLRYLYNIYNDWLLVVAAYNGGPGRVNQAIKASGSRDFWTLQHHLRLESSNHVKKFIATQFIMEGSNAIASIQPIKVNTTAPKKMFNPLANGAVAVDTSSMQTKNVSGRYNALVICKHILMDFTTFNLMNPKFDEQLAQQSSEYNLKLPKAKMDLFVANQLTIMNESLYLYLSLNNALGDTPTETTLKPKKSLKRN
jgi:membrane-bound lytic murein transglycosylase D